MADVVDVVSPTVNDTDLVVSAQSSVLTQCVNFIIMKDIFKSFKLNKATVEFHPAVPCTMKGIFAMWKATSEDEPSTVQEFFEKKFKEDPRAVVGRIHKQRRFEFDLPDLWKSWMDIDSAINSPNTQISWGIFSHNLQTTDIGGYIVVTFDVSFR